MNSTKGLFSLISLVVPFFLNSSVPVYADDTVARAKLEEAKTAYANRTDAAKLQAGLEAADKGLTEAEDKDLKYDLLVISSKLYYFKGMETKGDNDKVTIFETGRLQAEAGRQLGDYADAHYWAAACLARWGEAKGVLQALAKKNDLLKILNVIADKTARDGSDGEAYEGYGAARILGRVYFRLPAFAGGDTVKAIGFLKTAYEGAKDFGINVNYYAEALYTGDADQKKLAKQILDDLRQDPTKLNLNRVPENQEEYADAKKLREGMSD